jgi:hypothetical protein
MTTTRRALDAARKLFRPTAALVAAALLSVGAATPASADSDTLSGVYGRAGNVASVDAFSDWRKDDVQIVTDFVEGTSWATISDPTWLVKRWRPTGYKVAYTVPMLPKTGGTLQSGARGDYNVHFKKLAEVLVAHGEGDAILRIGWEMNGTWYSWSAVKDPAAYVSYWRQVVSTMRSVPGAQFRFDWSPNPGEGTKGFDKTKAYPGDAYVDIIGSSLYDQSWGHDPDQRAERWNYLVTQKGGLQWSVDFAKAHGKTNGFGEWGLSYRCDGNGGNDDPYFIQKVSEWIASHDYEYETYFDHTESGNCGRVHSVTSGPFPESRTAYLRYFGSTAAAAPAPAPNPVAAPAPATTGTVDASTVRVSWNADRTRDIDLAWHGVDGNVYVFAEPGFAVDRVRFYLDDPDMNGAPLSTEGIAPFDLKGGGSRRATAWDASALPDGRHTLTVAFDTPTGTRVAQVPFFAS